LLLHHGVQDRLHSSNCSELLPDGFLCSLVLPLGRTDLVQLTLQFARDAWSRAVKILEFVPEIEVLVVRCR